MSNISNVQVYGLEESITASGYPMMADLQHQQDSDREIERMRRLGRAKSGSGHDSALKGIVVQFDWRNSLLIQRQVLRYHFLDVVSSQSTMHRALKMDLFNQCNSYVDPQVVERLEEMIQQYNRLSEAGVHPVVLREYEVRILYSLPSGYELTARYTTNYLQLKTIYLQRRGHKLPEWKEFCRWCEGLPMFLELTGIVPNGNELEL